MYPIFQSEYRIYSVMVGSFSIICTKLKHDSFITIMPELNFEPFFIQTKFAVFNKF